jgi:hypothetical protein
MDHGAPKSEIVKLVTCPFFLDLKALYYVILTRDNYVQPLDILTQNCLCKIFSFWGQTAPPIALVHSPKSYDHFHGRTGNAEGNPSDGRKLFMLIFSRTTMKISEKARTFSRKTGKLFMV